MLASACLASASRAPLQPQVVGGYADVADLSAGGAEYKLAAFVLSELQAAGTDALSGAALQSPLIAAATQVVSGINHRIEAEVGLSSTLKLQVYEQSWTETLELTAAELDSDTIAEGVTLDYTAYTTFDPSSAAKNASTRSR